MKKLRILHVYKIYYPDVFGGIPYAIKELMCVSPTKFSHKLLVCSKKSNVKHNDYSNVERIKYYIELFSLPISLSYPFRLFQSLNKTDVVIIHAPFPLADLVFAAPLQKEIPLIVYWHADTVSHKFLGCLIRPLVRRTLERAKTIIVAHEKNIPHGSLLEDFKMHSLDMFVEAFPLL